MVLWLRKFTILFLILLQCIAPLVHGHTGNQAFGTGLHIPGLESYYLTSVPTPTKWCQKAQVYTGSEGVLVDLNPGLKGKQEIAQDNLKYFCCILPSVALVKILLTAFEVNFSPQSQSFIDPLVHFAFPARAPPLFHSYLLG